MEDNEALLTGMMGKGGNEQSKSADLSMKSSILSYEAKSENDINAIFSDVAPRLVMLVGFNDFGKSTLVASIYHQFLRKGEFCGWKLIDSETWTGFERRAFLRRVNDDSSMEESTKRTILRESYLLNMNLIGNDDSTYIPLVISDRAGEYYKKSSSVDDNVLSDVFYPRADHIAFFVDETKLEVKYFGALKNQYKGLLGKIQKFNKITSRTKIEIVFTKGDIIDAAIKAGEPKERREHIDEKKDEIKQLFKEMLLREDFNYIDVNSKDTIDNENIDGRINSLEPLFKYWMSDTDPATPDLLDNWVNKKIKQHG